MRQEYEAAEARGLIPADAPERKARSLGPTERATPSRTAGGTRMKVVWSVCDQGGRTVATFEYADKAAAEALIAQLKAKGKGSHFLRTEKVPMA